MPLNTIQNIMPYKPSVEALVVKKLLKHWSEFMQPFISNIVGFSNAKVALKFSITSPEIILANNEKNRDWTLRISWTELAHNKYSSEKINVNMRKTVRIGRNYKINRANSPLHTVERAMFAVMQPDNIIDSILGTIGVGNLSGYRNVSAIANTLTRESTNWLKNEMPVELIKLERASLKKTAQINKPKTKQCAL